MYICIYIYIYIERERERERVLLGYSPPAPQAGSASHALARVVNFNSIYSY